MRNSQLVHWGYSIRLRQYLCNSSILFILLSVACEEVVAPENIYTKDKLFEIAYSNYKYPEGFYSEELDGGSLYYVNTISIKPLEEREHIWIELSTNNRDTAFYWSELSCLNSSYYREYVSERQTEKYYEFRRVRESNLDDIILSRAHKSSYLDVSMYDRFQPGEVIGRYMQRPFQKEHVHELIEYLTFIRTYQTANIQILESASEELQNKFSCTLLKLDLSGGDWGVYDEVELWRQTYLIDKSTGDITQSEELVVSYKADYPNPHIKNTPLLSN